ncbi:MAG: GNAT family N-acetyltransferase [Pseudomonadota bacterium]
MSFDEGRPKAILIAVTRASHLGLRRLFAQCNNYLQEIDAAEKIFSVAEAELTAANCHSLLAVQDTKAAGCVILRDQFHFAEIKKLFVAASHLGLGIGRALMAKAEALAGEIGLRELKLKTGAALAEASALYRAMGFRECPAFGTYPKTGISLFMGKRLF